MMWMKLVEQRELIEIFVGSKRVLAQPVVSHERHPALPEDQVALYWVEDPQKVRALPFVALVPKSRYRKIFALLSAAPGLPLPFSAITRLVPTGGTRDSAKSQDYRSIALRAVAGLVLAELAVNQSKVAASDLKFSGIRQSFSFIFGRILAAVEVEALNEYILIEKDLRDVVADSREGLAASEKNQFEMLSVVYELASNAATSDIGRFCSELVKQGDASDSSWLPLVGRIGWKVPISQIVRMNREDRLGCFIELNSADDRGAPNVKSFCAAFLASLISPGTFDHLEVVRARGDINLVSWYCFVSSLQRDGAALQSGPGLGQRIHRDLAAQEDVFRPTTADASSAEILQMGRKELEKVWQLSSSVDSIRIEVAPGLILPFYRDSEDSLRNGGRAVLPGSQISLLPTAYPPTMEDSDIEAKLFEVTRLLSEIVSKLPAHKQEATQKEKPARTRTRPKKTL